MRLQLAIAILLMVTFQLLFAMTGKGQSIATEKVTIGLQDESLETAIKKMEQQSALRFFYRDEDILSLAHLNLAPDTRTIEQTLDILLQNTFLSFRQIDGHILLELKEQRAYYKIKGRVMDSTEKKPVANASVFLNNSTIGTVTDNNGSFKLNIARAGKYDLVVSIIGYGAYKKTLIVDKDNLALPDIEIAPEIISLSEVKVKIDPDRDKNYNWFKQDFLGNSNQAGKCTILNAELLDLAYDEKTGTLTASSSGFLEIENEALGYKIKYILTRFSGDKNTGKVSFDGSALFETLAGDQAQQKRWQKNRLKAYKGSSMHFLRSALYNQLDEEGFKVLRLKKKPIPNYPDKYIDSLGVTPLNVNDFVRLSDKKDIYALSFKDCLYVMYTKLHNYTGNLATIPPAAQPGYAKTTVTHAAPYTFFDNNGIIINPESIVFEGYWAESRVAELLPSDYEPDTN